MARIDVTTVPGGGVIYRRAEGGPFQLAYYVKGEGKLRSSLGLKDKEAALKKAEDLVLDMRLKIRQGIRITSATLKDVIRAWHELQLEKLERGEIRSATKVGTLHRFYIKKLQSCYGLETPVEEFTDEKWDEYIKWRGKNSEVRLSTIHEECKWIRQLCRVGLKHGMPCVPEMKLRVPVQEKAVRTETFTSEEVSDLVRQLEDYCMPDTPEGLYVRDWTQKDRAAGTKKRQNRLDQDMEESRRNFLRLFVRVLLASGARPNEIAGDPDASIRWRDIEIKETEVVQAMSKRWPAKKRVAMIRIRPMTKTGARVVPSPCGDHLAELKEITKFSGPDDFVFAEQFGIRAGEPMDLATLRLHWREVMRRWGFTRFEPTFYTCRHTTATKMITSGANLFLVAKMLGHSPTMLQKVYAKPMMETEEVLAQLYKEQEPILEGLDGGEL